jgi:hypothetical protein
MGIQIGSDVRLKLTVDGHGYPHATLSAPNAGPFRCRIILHGIPSLTGYSGYFGKKIPIFESLWPAESLSSTTP